MMSELPWGVYARLQQELASSCHVNNHTWYINDHTWGLEQGLNQLLTKQVPAGVDVDRSIRSASRKERYRRRLRRDRLQVETPASTHTENTLDARLDLLRAKAKVSVEEWAILRALGEGHEYREIAAEVIKIPIGRLRARVFRLRRVLRACAGNGQVA